MGPGSYAGTESQQTGLAHNLKTESGDRIPSLTENGYAYLLLLIYSFPCGSNLPIAHLIFIE